MAEQYHTLTRSELKGFDTRSQDIILEMMAEGWEGRRSAGSHVQLKNAHANGAVSPSNRNNVNYLRQLRNRGVVRPVTVSTVQQPAASRQQWPCPRCNKTFVDDVSLSRHNNQDHEHLLACPDCDSWHKDLRLLNIHRSKHHGYESPKKQQRLKAEAKRKEQKLTGSPYAAGQAAIAALFAGAQAEPAVDEELTALFEEPTAEQAVPAETTAPGGSQSLALAPIRDLTVAQLIAVAAAMGKTVEITVR